MKSANDHAREFFSMALAKGETRVTNVKLQEYVRKMTGQSRLSVSGTLDFTGPGTLVDSDWYTTFWHKEKADNNRIVHVHHARCNPILQREMDYQYPAKVEACKFIVQYLPASGTPRLLTLAGVVGNCVQAALKRNPATVIDNVEDHQNILTLWKCQKCVINVQTTDHNCTLTDFVTSDYFTSKSYALLNLDAMGYAGLKMWSYLDPINQQMNATIIVLTTQKLDNGFRNHGKEHDRLVRLYRDDPNPHAQAIVDRMTNYQMVDNYEYQKDFGNHWMEIFIFQCDPR